MIKWYIVIMNLSINGIYLDCPKIPWYYKSPKILPVQPREHLDRKFVSRIVSFLRNNMFSKELESPQKFNRVFKNHIYYDINKDIGSVFQVLYQPRCLIEGRESKCNCMCRKAITVMERNTLDCVCVDHRTLRNVLERTLEVIYSNLISEEMILSSIIIHTIAIHFHLSGA